MTRGPRRPKYIISSPSIPALAERVLRIANSVFLGRSGQIKNIYQAIMFLGFERIKSLSLGMTVLNAFPTRVSSTAENLWIHSYEVAYLSSLLAEYVPMTLPSECFLAGLLHDMGRIVFYGMDQKGFMQIETGASMFEQEREAFGCTHTVAGAWLVEALGMPTSSWLPLKPSPAVFRKHRSQSGGNRRTRRSNDPGSQSAC
jgi:HD-like signal output (HDOD) protein